MRAGECGWIAGERVPGSGFRSPSAMLTERNLPSGFGHILARSMVGHCLTHSEGVSQLTRLPILARQQLRQHVGGVLLTWPSRARFVRSLAL
jgi:hypothetical protein